MHVLTILAALPAIIAASKTASWALVLIGFGMVGSALRQTTLPRVRSL
jgi:hypothetical protein